jgi:hypothetical protein
MIVQAVSVCTILLVTLIVISWFIPKKIGIPGLFISHVLISFVTLTAILYDLVRGVVSDPDFIWLISNFCWITLANMLLLPITLFATYRYYVNKKRHAEESPRPTSLG